MPIVHCSLHGTWWDKTSASGCPVCAFGELKADEHLDAMRDPEPTEHGCFVTDRGPMCTCGWSGWPLTLDENLDEAREHARLTGGRILSAEEMDYGLISDADCELCGRECVGVRCPRCEAA